MKHLFFMLVSVLLLASCAPSKYTYKFDHYDYNSGRKKAVTYEEFATIETVSPIAVEESSPLTVAPETAVASSAPAEPAQVKMSNAAGKKYSDLSKTEKKVLRKAVKTEIKKYLKAKRGEGDLGKETQVLDYNLKMAIIFGAVALTLSFFGGVNAVFWVASVIALVIGVVFFIKWIAEQ